MLEKMFGGAVTLLILAGFAIGLVWFIDTFPVVFIVIILLSVLAVFLYLEDRS